MKAMVFMKKLLCFVLLLAMLLPMAVGCGDSEVTTADGTDPTTTTTKAPTTTNPPVTPDTPALPEGELVVKPMYTAVLNDEEWTNAEVGATSYDLSGAGMDIYQKVNTQYKDYKRTFVIVENGTESTYEGTAAFPALKKLGVCGATVTLDETAKTAQIKIVPVTHKVLSSWKAITAEEGAFFRFTFTTNLPIEYAVTVTPKEGGASSTSLYTESGITVKGDDGKYTGTAICSVPYQQGKTYYLNICVADGLSVLESIPLNIIKGRYQTGFQLVFTGEWGLIEDESYFDKFIDIFYHTYPKLFARFCVLGSEKRTVTLFVDKNYDGVASQSGGRVKYSANYLNNDSDRVGSFSHEITHTAEGYGGKLAYGGKDLTYKDPTTGEVLKYGNFFTENLANYGRLRYFEWSYSPQFFTTYDLKNDSGLWNWGYGEYGMGGALFLAWLDWNYPTLDKNSDGKITVDEYGAVDFLNYTIKTATEKLSDNPYDASSPFNKALSKATGGKFATYEEARQQYEADCKSGAFTFNGFSDYPDNFITENLPGVSENAYFKEGEVKPSDKTNPLREVAMTTGDNLCVGARIRTYASGAMGVNAIEHLIDGDLETRYQAKRSDKLYKLNKISNEIVIDLGKETVFDTYTIVFYGQQANYIAKDFEIMVSNDGGNFTAVDTRLNNTTATVSVTFDEVSARYVKIRLFNPDAQAGITRICEFMLFNSKK